MGVMGLLTIPRPRSGGRYTYADLEAFEEDGNRYELSYGTLIVSPAPNTRHQALAVTISSLLHRHKLPSQRVLVDAELLLTPDLVKIPDVQVVDENLVGGQSVVGIPELVVEIHSPATKMLDLGEKREVYAEAQIPSYWLVDPDTSTLTVLKLQGDAYVEMGIIDYAGSLEVSEPFTITLVGSEIFE
jgi:Uma2 family endonuclease